MNHTNINIKKIVSLITLFSFILSYPTRAMMVDEDGNHRSPTTASTLREVPTERDPLLNVVSNVNQTNPIESVQQWLETCISGEGVKFSNCKKNSILIVEVFSGSARGAVYFKLGYDLAMRLSIDEPWRSILSSAYGVCVFLPMAVLGTRSSSRVFKRLLTQKLQVEKNIECEQPCAEKSKGFAKKSVALTAGLLSAPPLTYLAYDKLDPVLSWGWVVPGIPTYYVRTLIDYDATTTLIDRLSLSLKVRKDRLHATYDDKGAALNREALLTNIRDNHLNPARAFINSLNFEQADSFTEEMEKQSDVLRQTNLLFHPQSIIPQEEVNIQTDHIVKKILSIIGGGVGIYGSWIFYPMAEKSWIPVLTVFGIDSTESLQTVLAVISLASVSPVTYISSESSTSKFCSAVWKLGSSICGVTHKEDERVVVEEVRIRKEEARERERNLRYKRIGAAIFSTFFAICFAFSQTEIAEEFFDINRTEVRFNLFAQAISTFSLVFWAVDELLLDYLKAGDPRTPFLKKIEAINNKLDALSQKSLRNLERYLH